jgi:hypothetical protein
MLEHKVLNTADTIIVTSKTTKKEFEAITDKPIAVITNGVENIETQPLDIKFFGAYWFFSFRAKSYDFMGDLVELISEVPDFKPFGDKINGSVSQEV